MDKSEPRTPVATAGDPFAATPDPAWSVEQTGYHILTETAAESRLAIGNGFIGMRASRSTSRGPTWVSWLGYIRWASWPRTYVAGLFDVPNTDPPIPALVPVADWSRVRIFLDGEPLIAREGRVLDIARSLDMRRAVLTSTWTHHTPSRITTTGRDIKLLSQADRAIGLQVIRMSLDRGGVDVRVEASFAMAGQGMEPARLERDLGAWRTEGGGKSVAMAATASLHLDGTEVPPEHPFPLRWSWRLTSVAGQQAEFVRMVGVARSDTPGEDPSPRATAALARATSIGWRAVLNQHEAAWARRWAAAGVTIAGDDELQHALRFAIYHLTSAANPQDELVSVGARALTGDVYFGHVFWDTEIYLLPFYTAVWPAAARAMLMYRHHTLPGARAKATAMGYKGALFAWESADTGEETTPDHVIGPTGERVEVLTGTMEQHIAADVAYAVWHYWNATGDDDFLVTAGAEIILETGRFWASRAAPEADGKRHIRHVIGPDEYHEDVDNSAFTNVLARWNIERALDVLHLLQARWPAHAAALWQRLGLSEAECADWRDAATRLVTGFDPATGLYEEFAGFHNLEYIDLAPYAGRTLPIDVVLGRDRTQRSQIVKQADIVALIALLPDAFPARSAEGNFRYYEPRCAHGSSLSAGMHAMVAARLGMTDLALHYLRIAARADLDDNPNSAGGIRIAGLGAVWQAVVLGFGGLDLGGDIPMLKPQLPPDWSVLSFSTQWRGRLIAIRVEGGRAHITLRAGEAMTLRIWDVEHQVSPGADLDVACHPVDRDPHSPSSRDPSVGGAD